MAFNHAIEHVDENMLIIQANIDDMNPEWVPHVGDLLLAAGANDVYWIPIVMKKGRPGLMLNVLVDELLAGQMEQIIFRETTTLGLRYIRAACHRLGRKQLNVETPWGVIAVKVGIYNGQPVQYAPEFADCERAAKANGIPLKLVYDEVRKMVADLPML